MGGKRFGKGQVRCVDCLSAVPTLFIAQDRFKLPTKAGP